MPTTIVLVRHADSVVPVPGGPDEYHRPLTAHGLTQAGELAWALAALKPDAIWSSPYLRAIQTVTPAASSLNLPVETREDLREWDSGFGPTPDWQTFVSQSWADPSHVWADGESLAALTVRAAGAVRDLAAIHTGQTVLVGSHGSFLSRALVGLGLMVDRDFHLAMPMPAVYPLDFADAFALPTATGPGL